MSAPGALALVLLAACGEAPQPAVPPAPTPTVAVPTAPTATASATAVAAQPAPDAEGAVRLFPVARIYSLLGVTATEGTIEVRIGYDPGGGIVGRYRYAPIVNGAVDLDQETDELIFANTAMDASIELAGKRPQLLRRATSGFRSEASDRYELLDADGLWHGYSLGEREGVGWSIFAWSEDRLLEWRKHVVAPTGPEQMEHWLPEVRVIRGKNKEAPSLPAALKKRLQKEGFMTAALTAFRTGEVLAVGTTLLEGDKVSTVLWKDKLNNPEYFVSAVDLAKEATLEPEILGGDSLSTVRLLCGGRVLKLDGKAWVEESKVPESGLPDVWFGSTMVKITDKGPFARMAAGSPWMPLALVTPEGTSPVPPVDPSFAVDGEGVIWATIDDLLVSSKPPAGGMVEITEAELVKRRKASVLRGGSDDATGQPPGMGGMPKCSTHYVLLDKMKVSASAETADYSAVRKALKGHSEFSNVKLVVSREKGYQLFGAQTADAELAKKLAEHIRKATKAQVLPICAEPAAVREIKLDFATGEIAK